MAGKVVAALFSDRAADHSASDLVRNWAYEFYRLRNDFAHGKMRSRQPRAWNAACHLLLGAIVFPVLVKNLLSQEGIYRMTRNDHAEAGAFSRFAADLRDPARRPTNWLQYAQRAFTA